MNNIAEWMVENKIAENFFAAGHLVEGLKLMTLSREEQEARCILYRRWRPKTDKKNELKSFEAYALAIAGIDPDDVPARQIDLPFTDNSPIADGADEAYHADYYKGIA